MGGYQFVRQQYGFLGVDAVIGNLSRYRMNDCCLPQPERGLGPADLSIQTSA